MFSSALHRTIMSPIGWPMLVSACCQHAKHLVGAVSTTRTPTPLQRQICARCMFVCVCVRPRNVRTYTHTISHLKVWAFDFGLDVDFALGAAACVRLQIGWQAPISCFTSIQKLWHALAKPQVRPTRPCHCLSKLLPGRGIYHCAPDTGHSRRSDYATLHGISHQLSPRAHHLYRAVCQLTHGRESLAGVGF